MPWTNNDIQQLMSLLTEIRDKLTPLPVIIVPEKGKGGRPKGSRNVKRIGKHQHRADE